MERTVTKFLLALIGMMLAIALSIATAINGYGLTVHSWGWLIWGGIGSAVIGAVFSMAND